LGVATKKKTPKKTPKRKKCVSPRSGQNLTPGNPGNTGGKKGRSGRRPTAISLAAQEIADKYSLLEVAKDIAVADIWEEWVNKDGKPVAGPTKNSDRLAAIKLILEYGHGKPRQTVGIETLSEEERMDRLLAILAEARERQT
jgi:hypothetical protein